MYYSLKSIRPDSILSLSLTLFSRGFYTNPASKMIVNEFCVILNITCIAFSAPLNVENTEKGVQFCSAKSM